ncbi:MAG TPA: GvpL/GvpF family gas vesicle protein [Pyrinomonadaceae bacterium]
MSGTNAYYVYCVVEKSAAAEVLQQKSPVAIEESSALELIDHDDLSSVVSQVSLQDYGEETLAARLTDASWTAIRAMRHEHVVEHFSRRTSTVPLRFGTIYLDRRGIETMLREQEAQLTAILARLKDREEWGVNVYCDRAVLLENITNVSPRLRELTAEAKKASAGQSYLLQKKIETLKTDEAKVEMARAAEQIEKRLADESEGASKLRILKVETTEHGELKAKFAFLVVKSNFKSFHQVAEELARELAQAGIRIELTGPWPAYNFATV